MSPSLTISPSVVCVCVHARNQCTSQVCQGPTTSVHFKSLNQDQQTAYTSGPSRTNKYTSQVPQGPTDSIQCTSRPLKDQQTIHLKSLKDQQTVHISGLSRNNKYASQVLQGPTSIHLGVPQGPTDSIQCTSQVPQGLTDSIHNRLNMLLRTNNQYTSWVTQHALGDQHTLADYQVTHIRERNTLCQLQVV